MAFSGQNLVSDVSPREIQTLQVPHGGVRAFALVVRDRKTGLPKAVPSDAVVKLVAVYQWGSDSVVFNKQATITNASAGEVSVTLDATNTSIPGIYTATLAVFEVGALTHSQPFYIEIEPVDLYQSVGTPTLAEVRLHLRDTAPESNYLLDETEFSDSEIAASVRWAVDLFNESLPVAGQRYTVATFPYRYHWLQAIVALLMRTAAAHYRRNRLSYSAGGITIDKEGNKASEYETIAKERMDEYKKWVQDEKIRINIDGGFLTVDSPYVSVRRW